MGKTLTEMGDHRAAERHYRSAMTGRTLETYQRTRALTIANRAKSVGAQRRHEEAVALWAQFLDAAGDVTSDRSRKELATLRSTMTAYAKRRIAGTAALGERAALVPSDPIVG